MEAIYTCDEAAKRYQVNIHTVWDWIRKDKLSAIRISKRVYRISESDLINFKKRSKV